MRTSPPILGRFVWKIIDFEAKRAFHGMAQNCLYHLQNKPNHETKLPHVLLTDRCICNDLCSCLCFVHRRGRNICTSFRSEEHTSELQSRENLVCRLLL